jgi:hypothetical protein
MPVPTKKQMKDFCSVDGWEPRGKPKQTGAGGAKRKTGDHLRYRKILDDGTVLNTRVSHGSGGESAFDDPRLWKDVWSRQLGLDSEDQFWEALRTGDPVQRGGPAASTQPDGPSKPSWLVDWLIHRVGLDEADVLAMSEDEAMARYHESIAPPEDR